MTNVSPDTAWNTAVSFTTNTNWQNYAGEATMGYLTQIAALMVQQFMSAAVGLAVAIAMIRGFTRSRTDRLGNFWVDLTRGTIRLLLPIAIIGTIILVAGGAIENLANYHTITTLAGGQQTIPGGAVASQEVIKDLGNNGGGWFNVNAAHPFENPNPFTNIFEIFLLLLIPFATPRAFGKMVGDNRQGYALVAAMVIIWAARGRRDQLLRDPSGHRRESRPQLAHGAYEGVETRFGPPGCSLFAASTTVTSTGAVNCFHDSLTPFGGGIALFDIALGEIAPGGIGAGMYGILVLAMVTVFVAGLMVGRTPEYIGKKIRPVEMKYASLYFLTLPVVILTMSAIAIGTHWGQSAIFNPGYHGLTEVVYAYASHGEQQRVGVRGPGHRGPVLPDHRRHHDAARPVRAGDLRPGPGRVAGQTGARAGQRRDAGHQDAAVRRHARRRDPHPRRPDLLPRARAGPVRRRTALMSVTTESPGTAPASRPQAGTEPRRVGGGFLDPKMLWKSTPDALVKLDPRVQIKNPVMFVVEVGALLCMYTAIRSLVGVQLDHRGLAVADRGVREPGRGGGRGPRQGAGRDAAPGQARDDGATAGFLAARGGSRIAAGGVRYPARS